MKLFYKPGACSLSPHIALIEAGLPYTLEAVDLATKKTASGADFKAITPKGQVPTLQLDDGSILTEGAAIVQYIADKAPQSGLAPAAGTLERYHLIEWLSYIGTELHKGFSPLFNSKMPEEAKAIARTNLAARYDWLSTQIKDNSYLTGSQFTIADGYLFTVLSWSNYVGLDLAKWPTLAAYHARVGARPAVQKALAEESTKAAA